MDPESQMDGVMGAALRRGWDQGTWDAAMAVLRRSKRAALACDTYALYQRLLQANANEVDSLVRQAEVLFRKRARNGFYGGGPQTQGGGPDNDFTVDYRLAAILKKLGYTGETIHLWRWG
jgi:hypothetical protein